MQRYAPCLAYFSVNSTSQVEVPLTRDQNPANTRSDARVALTTHRYRVIACCSLLLWAVSQAVAADATLEFVLKQQKFLQTNAGPAALQSNSPFQFQSTVYLTTPGSLTNAVLATPGGGVRNLTSGSGGTQLKTSTNFSSQAALDATYSNGTDFITNFAVHDGVKTATFNLTSNAYPTAPQISNFAALQSVNPSNALTVSWFPFTNGTANDFIVVSISPNSGPNLYQSPLPGQPGALNGTATSLVIAANSIPAGRTNPLQVTFVKTTSTDTNGYPGAFAFGGFLAQTTCNLTTTGQPDTQPPFLDDNSPRDGQTNLPRNAVVAFTFNKPMASSYSINWSNVLVGNFTFSWTADHLTLVCNYNTPLPANTSIGWALNPSGQGGSGFQDISGNFLPFDSYSGSFTTGSGTSPLDTKLYLVGKGQQFLQTSASAPTLQTNSPFQFTSFVQPSFSFALTNGMVQIPGGSSRTLTLDTYEGQLYFEDNFSNQAALDAGYSNGNYTVTLSTIHDGTRIAGLTLAGNAYPNTPTVSNFAAAQAINPTNNFALGWLRFAGGTTNDFIQVEIRDNNDSTVFSTGEPGSSSFNGTNTSVTIPANILAPGRAYQSSLLFAKFTSTNTASYPGVPGVAGYFKKTTFGINTLAVGPLPDLAPAELDFNSTIYSSSTNPSVFVFWGVTNQGAGGAVPQWYDALYFSSNSVLDASAVRLGNFNQNSGVPGGSNYFNGTTVSLPVSLSGDYYLILSVDDGNDVAEAIETNNVLSMPISVMIGSAPFLNNTYPYYSQFDVPLNAVIAFTFDEPMATNYSITWGGSLDPNAFRYTWTPDQTTLLCIYTNNFDSNSSNYWALNPSSLPGGFRDLYGNYLDFDSYSSYFYTGSTANSADASLFLIAKGQLFNQTNSGLPTLSTNLPFRFTSFVKPTTPFAVTNASLQIPGGASHALALDPFNNGELDLQTNFASQSALDGAYSNGNFTMTVNTAHDGNRQAGLILVGNLYPNTPQVLNFAQAQLIDAGSDFNLTWAAFAGGTSNDYVSLEIDDPTGSSVFSTGDIGGPGLNGTNTSVVIPAYTLYSCQQYSATLLFAKVTYTNSTSYPNALGLAAYFKRTQFSLNTVGPTLIPTSLTAPSATTSLTIPVFWTVLNAGTGAAQPNWSDTLYLSTTNYFDGSALYLADYQQTNAVAPGASDTNNQSVKLPVTNSGTYYLILTVDTYDFAGECNQTSNQMVAAILVNLPIAPIFTVTNTSDSGPGSLRQAILNANAVMTNAVIQFNIAPGGTQTIQPLSPLPTVTRPVMIDGTTQPGYAGRPIIELKGNSAGASAWGLDIAGGSSTVRGLVINRFSLDGIHLSLRGTNVIQGNYIGTDLSGRFALSNTLSGVTVDNCANNLIGGTFSGAGNLLSGNGQDGLDLNLSGSFSSIVQGNLIGVDGTGTNALGNGRMGIVVWRGGNNNTVGGTISGARNIISGNAQTGVVLTETNTSGNLVQGNYIGTDLNGAKALGNGVSGISIVLGASTNTIGGTIPQARNVISGNLVNGLIISDPGTSGNQVQNNYIGTDVSGLLNLSNAFNGVAIQGGASGNKVGGSPYARNLISGNGNNGVAVRDTNTIGNFVVGNSIGADATGAAPLGNANNGVVIRNGASANIIGNVSLATTGNVISGNGHDGVLVADPGTGRNIISGNYIGTDVTGLLALGNAAHGVSIGGGSSNAVGADHIWFQPNVISGNGGLGVLLSGNGNTRVQGNYIGTDVTGTNALGNRGGGVWVQLGGGNATNYIGVNGLGNAISGNLDAGVALCCGTSNNLVQGNFIGADPSGTYALGNAGSGVIIYDDADGPSYNNSIGGASFGNGNVIAFNRAGPSSSGNGVEIQSGTNALINCINNAILGNSIFSNQGLGIELGTNTLVHTNDLGDTDSGPNDLQNFPIIFAFVTNFNTLWVQGSLNSRPNSIFRLEFFANATCDPSGYGEGQTFLTGYSVTTDPSGNVTFVLGLPVAAGSFLTATATDTYGNTSEFSPCVALTVPDLAPAAFIAPVNVSSPTPYPVISVAWAVTNQGTGPAFGGWYDRVWFSINGVLDGHSQDLGDFFINVSTPFVGRYWQTNQVTLPMTNNGFYTLFLQADVYNSLYELNESNNVSAAAPGVFTLAAPPRLAIFFTNQAPYLLLYGRLGASYLIEYSTNLASGIWQFGWRVPLASSPQTVAALSASSAGRYYRATEFAADPPILELRPPAATNILLLLYGQAGNNYFIESETNLAPGGQWSAGTSLVLTNSFQFLNEGTPTNGMRLYRARRP